MRGNNHERLAGYTCAAVVVGRRRAPGRGGAGLDRRAGSHRAGQRRFSLGDCRQGTHWQAAGGAVEVVESFQTCLLEQGFTPLAITTDHALRAGSLPGSHRDPFDRMLIAQAQAENIPLISNETLFDGYGIRRIW